MWIEDLKNGKFRACERYTDPMTGKVKRTTVTMDKNTTSTRKAAQKKLNEKIKELTFDYKKEHDNLTFGDLVDEYLCNKKTTVKSSTYTTLVSQMNPLKKLIGSDTLVTKLCVHYVMDCINGKYTRISTINGKVNNIKKVLTWGYQHDYIDDISWTDKFVTLNDEEKKKKLEEKYLEKEELLLLLDRLDGMWKDTALCLSLTGMRIGELLALNVDDVDLEKREIHISKTRNTMTGEISSTKTFTSTRTIFIQDELYDLCKRLVTQANESQFINKHKRLFNYIDHDYSQFQRLIKAAGDGVINKNITSHIFRHTHVSLLAEQGFSLELISRRIGHKRSDITRDIYYHVTEKLKEKDKNAIMKVSLL